MLEHCARNGLLIAGITADLLLACLVLHRLAGVSRLAMACAAVLGLVATASLVVTARVRAPKADALARLLDDRCGTNNLFASSLEFQRSPERFGWLGELTCQYAAERAAAAIRWPTPSRRTRAARPRAWRSSRPEKDCRWSRSAGPTPGSGAKIAR